MPKRGRSNPPPKVPTSDSRGISKRLDTTGSQAVHDELPAKVIDDNTDSRQPESTPIGGFV